MKKIVIAVLAALAVAPAALADGGTSIAEAPELPIGQPVSGAVARLDYWGLNILSGDKLRIDYEPVGMNGVRVALCMLLPSITDFTISKTECFDFPIKSSDRKSQAIYEFALSGRYTLVIGALTQKCFVLANDVNWHEPKTDCADPVGYNLTAYLSRVTRVLLQPPPRLVRKGTAVNVRGKVVGANAGSVAVQLRRGGRWANVGIAGIAEDGSFVVAVKATTAGKFRYRIMYPGDESRKGSVAGFRFTVI